MEENYRFKVNLSGMIDILGNNIYTSNDVFMRELLQNGIDAISARRNKEPDFNEGQINITLYENELGNTIEFHDNGIGLTEDDIHEFLAIIGQSSKRDENTREDYIGQFGIGLLSCFMVSEQINIITRSVNDSNTYLWKGKPDGTYTINKLETSSEIGTTIYLKCKQGAEEYYTEEKIEELVKYYGDILPIPIYFRKDNFKTRLNNGKLPSSSYNTKEEILDYGRHIFDEDFIDCFEIKSKTGKVTGIAYIISHEIVPNKNSQHHIYLKNMFLTREGNDLLPEWGFFIKCVLNIENLVPTASRESFYKNDLLEQTKNEIEECIINYLSQLSNNNPNLLTQIIGIHSLAIKSLSVEDEDMYKTFIEYLMFPTNEGNKTGKEIINKNSKIVYSNSIDTFRQLSGIYLAQNSLLVNAGYIYDEELIKKLEIISNTIVEKVSDIEIENILKDISFDDYEISYNLLKTANIVLNRFKCNVDIKTFNPNDLPALFVLDEKATLYRGIIKDKEEADNKFTSLFDGFQKELENSAYSKIYLNFDNPLIKKLLIIKDKEALSHSIELIYLQTLLVGHFTLAIDELKLLNTGLISLLEWGIGRNNE